MTTAQIGRRISHTWAFTTGTKALAVIGGGHRGRSTSLGGWCTPRRSRRLMQFGRGGSCSNDVRDGSVVMSTTCCDDRNMDCDMSHGRRRLYLILSHAQPVDWLPLKEELGWAGLL